jgi:uncharacterized membrane protein YozB (DUF420 family)
LGWIGIAVWIVAAVVLYSLTQSNQIYEPIATGSRIWLGAGLNAAAQVVMIVALLFGWRFARAGDYRRHRRVQTTVVMLNWLAILFVMGVSFGYALRDPGSLAGGTGTAAIGHGIVGLLAALSGTYLVVRMVFERVLPDGLKLKNFKRLMQATMVLWLLVAVGGLYLFVAGYLL